MAKPNLAAPITKAMEDYKTFLMQAQGQYEKTIREATAQLNALIAASSAAAVEQPEDPPQSVWVTGNDGEKFLMLNQPAADLISDMIEQLKGVVAELAKTQAKK